MNDQLRTLVGAGGRQAAGFGTFATCAMSSETSGLDARPGTGTGQPGSVLGKQRTPRIVEGVLVFPCVALWVLVK